MQTSSKPAKLFSKSDLKPGDILLLAIKEYTSGYQEAYDFFLSAKRALDAWNEGKSPDIIFEAAMPMIHIAIAVFDDDRFFHAALVGYPMQGGRDSSVVIEIGTKGMQVTDLDAYLASLKNGVAAVRYCAGDAALGSDGLPFAPVIETANELLTGEPIKYGYFNAFVLAMLCTWRRTDGLLLNKIEQTLIDYFGEGKRSMIEAFFKMCGPQLKDMLFALAHAAGDMLRHKKELVCSEMVATAFNDTINPKSGNAYEISLQRRAVNRGGGLNREQPDETPSQDQELNNLLQEMAKNINAATYSKSVRDPGLFFTASSNANGKPGWWGNNLYTPSDLSNSINTHPLGDWNGS